MPTNPMGILYEQNYNAQAENVREDFIPENLPTVQHVQINFGLKHRSLTNSASRQVNIEWRSASRVRQMNITQDSFKVISNGRY